MERFNPVLSGTLSEIISTIVVKYNDPIATELLCAHKLVEDFNRVFGCIDDELSSCFYRKIISLITDEVSMLTVRTGESDDFDVSFLPKGKTPIYNGSNWSRQNRQTGKIGRIVRKLLVADFKTKDWEDFTNRFKAEKCCCINFELVSGYDITRWYDQDNYYKISGTLGNSCMRYPECSRYFQLYEDKAFMLISTKDGALTGRAIVWKMEDNITLLDRIYTCFDYLEDCFIEYAKEHKWWIRAENSLLHTGENQYWLTPENNYTTATDREFKINVPAYKYWPYVDSFRYYNENEGTISTINDDYAYALDDTGGSYSGGNTWECDCCHEIFRGYDDEMPEEIHYSDYEDRYLCDDCCWYCEELDDYISNADIPIDVYARRYEIVTYPQSYVNDYVIDKCIKVENNPDAIVAFGHGKYYKLNHPDVYWNECLQQYAIRSDSD